MPEKQIIIIAPHPDDEIIGNFEIVSNNKTTILYDASTSRERQADAMLLKEYADTPIQLFVNNIPSPFMNTNNTYHFPDPIYETHPLHRKWGHMGEQMAREGYDVIFYNTNMNAPYIHEVEKPNDKLHLLNLIYSNQNSLWEYDHKYYLFEGRNKWIF